MIPALTWLVALQLAGEVLVRLLKLPLPGALVGLVLLLAALLARGQVSVGLQQTSQVLLQNLMLLFIPLIAGIVSQRDAVSGQWLPFVATCVLGAILSLMATAWTLRWMLARQQRAERDDH